MTKIAYNTCHGGFSLSNAGIEALLNRKGIAWESTDDGHCRNYWHVGKAGMECIDTYDLYDDRTNPDLIAVIEELGDKAHGDHAQLSIKELPLYTQYRIREYDGMESIETPNDIDWKTA